MSPVRALKIGDKAPSFTLVDQDGQKVRLSDYLGKQKVLLFFYPGDMTPGCTMQLCAVRDDYRKFCAEGIAVFGINHGDAASHERFRKKHSLPFPLLIDVGKKVSAKYDALKTFFKAKMIKRSVVGIDEQGTIIYLKRSMPKNSDILKAMT